MGDDLLESLLGTVVLGRFLVDEVIGEGAFCRVFHARTREGDEVVVKALARRSPRGLARHQREVAVLRGLPDNPYVAAYVDDGATSEGVPLLVLEYVEGATLKQVMRRMEAVEERHAAAAVAQICEALSDLHGLGIVHRDVKPSNVILSTQKTIKLVDFGLVLDGQGIMGLLESETSHRGPGVFDRGLDHGVLAGTLSYMAPEQFSDVLATAPEAMRTDTQADVYSLGVVLFELISGQVPIAIDLVTHLADEEARLRDVILWRLRLGDDQMPPLPGASPALESIVRKALRFEPELRHVDARELGAELYGFLASGTGAAGRPQGRTEQVVLPEHRAGDATETWPRPDAAGGAPPRGAPELDDLTRPFFDRTVEVRADLDDEATRELDRK